MIAGVRTPIRMSDSWLTHRPTSSALIPFTSGIGAGARSAGPDPARAPWEITALHANTKWSVRQILTPFVPEGPGDSSPALQRGEPGGEANPVPERGRSAATGEV